MDSCNTCFQSHMLLAGLEVTPFSRSSLTPGWPPRPSPHASLPRPHCHSRLSPSSCLKLLSPAEDLSPLPTLACGRVRSLFWRASDSNKYSGMDQYYSRASLNSHHNETGPTLLSVLQMREQRHNLSRAMEGSGGVQGAGRAVWLY